MGVAPGCTLGALRSRTSPLCGKMKSAACAAALSSGLGLAGCVSYYDLQLRPAELPERRMEVGANDEVCTQLGRRFNLQYAHEAKEPPPSRPAPEGYRTYRFGPGEPGSVETTPPWIVLSLVFMGAGVAAATPPALICLASCNNFPDWATGFAIAGGTLFAAGVSFLVVALADPKAGTYTREPEVIDMGRGAPCAD